MCIFIQSSGEATPFGACGGNLPIFIENSSFVGLSLDECLGGPPCPTLSTPLIQRQQYDFKIFFENFLHQNGFLVINTTCFKKLLYRLEIYMLNLFSPVCSRCRHLNIDRIIKYLFLRASPVLSLKTSLK